MIIIIQKPLGRFVVVVVFVLLGLILVAAVPSINEEEVGRRE